MPPGALAFLRPNEKFITEGSTSELSLIIHQREIKRGLDTASDLNDGDKTSASLSLTSRLDKDLRGDDGGRLIGVRLHQAGQRAASQSAAGINHHMLRAPHGGRGSSFTVGQQKCHTEGPVHLVRLIKTSLPSPGGGSANPCHRTDVLKLSEPAQDFCDMRGRRSKYTAKLSPADL